MLPLKLGMTSTFSIETADCVHGAQSMYRCMWIHEGMPSSSAPVYTLHIGQLVEKSSGKSQNAFSSPCDFHLPYFLAYKALPQMIPAFLIMPALDTLLCW